MKVQEMSSRLCVTVVVDAVMKEQRKVSGYNGEYKESGK